MPVWLWVGVGIVAFCILARAIWYAVIWLLYRYSYRGGDEDGE